MPTIETQASTPSPEVDAVVIGAGFAGLYAAYRLRQLGLSYAAFEQGAGVGGTWYWNRYPGAGSDSESWVYSYTFSEELEQDWTWSCRFPGQAEILRYLEHVADRFDLRASFQFNTRITRATYEEASERWRVVTEQGGEVCARYLITAVGCLSAAQVPTIPGLEQFKGSWYHTGQWPHAGVDFTGLRVGVVGTGSSGIQCIPVIAQQCAYLTVFQRTPNFSIPARNAPLSAAQVEELKRNIKQIRETCRWSTIGQPYDWQDAEALKLDPKALQERFEADWQKGGFEWMFGSFRDLLADPRANDLAADFVREKIRSAVTDPAVARKLIPSGYPIGTKRLPLDANYFETFNRDNVELVDLRATPIEEITAEGIRTRAQTHALDALIFATGFDAMTGPLNRIAIHGRNDQALTAKWCAGPQTYLGVCTQGFPNLFMVTGPGSPSVLGNMPTSIEQHVDWICACLEHLREAGATRIEATQEAEDQWGAQVQELAAATLFPQADSWYMGANVPGKPRVFLPYIGGFGTYRRLCADIAAQGYPGFSIR